MTEHPSSIFGITEEKLAEQSRIEQDRQLAERQQAEGREQRETKSLHAELEGYLTRRGEDFQKLTGRPPTEAELQSWQLEFSNAREREHEAEQKRRHDSVSGQVF